jgi:tRNA 2-selenouridine synthase
MKDITYEESLNIENPLYIDVRSPGEFQEDHIPGAINLPIFNNEERAEVGTIYKLIGREEAVIRGTEIGGKRIGDIINALTQYSGRNLVIGCARGGMRSGAVASLLESLGISTFRLKDGYKSYRRHVLGILNNISIKPRLFILQGLTGAGKTEIIKYIKNSIDIEGLAGHRSSVFGAIGLEQSSQKAFETGFCSGLLRLSSEAYMVFEGESRKVGNLHIPDNIFMQMRKAPAIFIDTPIERRVEIIKKEYDRFHEHEKVIKIVRSLKHKISAAKIDRLIELYTSGKIDEFIEILLTDYYDALYGYTLKKMSYIDTLVNNNSEETAGQVIAVIENYMEKEPSGAVSG